MAKWYQDKQIKKSIKEIEFLNNLRRHLTGGRPVADEGQMPPSRASPPPIPARIAAKTAAPHLQEVEVHKTEAQVHVQPALQRAVYKK